jgi:hypothetical protein
MLSQFAPLRDWLQIISASSLRISEMEEIKISFKLLFSAAVC